MASTKNPTTTQYTRLRELRDRLLKLFPELAEIKDEMNRLLDDAQNPPPDGASDGTIEPTQYNQSRSIAEALSRLLITQLFDSKPAGPKPEPRMSRDGRYRIE
jgi:hypothetical protein